MDFAFDGLNFPVLTCVWGIASVPNVSKMNSLCGLGDLDILKK